MSTGNIGSSPDPEAPSGSKCLTYSVTEAAEILGISRTNAFHMVQRGTIPSIRLGHRWLIPRAAIEKLLAGAGGAA